MHNSQVVIAARREVKLDEVAEEIKSAGGDVAVVMGDVSKVRATDRQRTYVGALACNVDYDASHGAVSSFMTHTPGGLPFYTLGDAQRTVELQVSRFASQRLHPACFSPQFLKM